MKDVQRSALDIERRAQRARRLGMLAALLLALLFVLGLGGRHLMEARQGVAAVPLPPLAAISSAAPPRFLFSIHGVSRPLGVAVSPTGDRIYVTESGGDRETRVFDRDGKPGGALTPPGSRPESRTPIYVATDPRGRVYVSDRRPGAIHVYSSAGDYQGQMSPPPELGGSWAPMALNVDAGGRLLVTDVSPDLHSVMLLDADGNLLRRLGPKGAEYGDLSYPNGVAVDRHGRILVADSNGGRVLMLDPGGNLLWPLGRGGVGPALGLPRGLAVDDHDRAYVVDTMSHAVLVFDVAASQPRLLFTLGGQGMEDGQFNFPNGIALDQTGRLYITDRENNRVQVWTY